MPKFVALFVFAVKEFFKSLSIFLLENSENLLCNTIFSKSFQLPFNFKLIRTLSIFVDYGILAHRLMAKSIKSLDPVFKKYISSIQ
mgnify:CR=1 FL=1